MRDLLSFVLTPAQLALFDLDTLTVASNVMTSTQDLKALYSDLLVKVRLVLHAMANIWEADERAFIGWLQLVHELPEPVRRQLLNSVYFYFLNVCEEVKMERLQKELEANEPGDEIMQEIHAQMEDLMSVSVGEIRKLGLLEGMERGALSKAQDIAKRFIAEGWSNEAIRKYTDLSAADINQLREESGAG